MKKTKQVSPDELATSLMDLYWTLHRHSKASNKCATLEWIHDKDSDKFASDGCISGHEFEKFMPKARKLIQRIWESKKVRSV